MNHTNVKTCYCFLSSHCVNITRTNAWDARQTRRHTHAQQQALVLLDGAQAAQESSHHDDSAQGDDEVGGGERREGGRQGGEAALRHRQPHAHTQQATPTQLKHKQTLPVDGMILKASSGHADLTADSL